MYIVKNAAGYAFSDFADNAVAVINAPIVEENGDETILEKCEEGYKSLGFLCTETLTDEGRGLFSVERTIKNTGYTTRIIKFIFETVTEFVPTKYLIPCVSYNGNKFGDGHEPKGMLHKNGKPWIHSFERTCIPSCSLTEDKTVAFSMFADAKTKESMVSSVSLRPVGDKIAQRIYWPVTEAPYTYYENDKYNEPLHTYITLAALDLYEFTNDKKYLEYALKASYYFASWMYTYDGYYGPEKEFTQYGYYTSGSTAVSVQHPALDQWGELMCCEWLRLADYTGDERWRHRALMMWYNATQCIADENNRIYHGVERPIGAQNEAFYQARWGHRPNCNESGHLNDWCVSWVNVFRLNVIDRLTRINKYPDTSSLE